MKPTNRKNPCWTICWSLLVLLACTSGCGRSASNERPSARHPKQATPQTRTGVVEQAQRAVKGRVENAQDAVRHDFDDIRAEAEQAVERTQKSVTGKAKKHTQDLSEFAAEMAEDAKDRAEDVPVQFDRALNRGLQKFQDGVRDSVKKYEEK